MRVAVHQPHYIPWLGYFHKIAGCDLFVLLDTVQYKKREFQNRNRIKAPNGPLWLTIPVFTKGNHLQSINEVKIDNQERWREIHLHSLERNYAHAPYYKKYRNFLEEIYGQEWESLIEVNMATIKYLGRALNLDTPLMLESTIGTTQTQTARIIEICQKVKADIYLSGQGAKDYLDENLLAQNGIKLEYQEFVHPVYPQLYGPFIPYLSALDLIFNCGTNSKRIMIG